MANGQLGDCLTTQDPLEMHFCCPVNQLVVDLRGLIQAQEQTGARGLNELLSHVVQRWGQIPGHLAFPKRCCGRALQVWNFHP